MSYNLLLSIKLMFFLGLKIYVQDANEEIQHFAFHMNIDKPLNGIARR